MTPRQIVRVTLVNTEIGAASSVRAFPFTRWP